MLDRGHVDRSIRALVITGSGGSFYAGGDLKAIWKRQNSADPDVRSADAMRRRIPSGHTWVDSLRSLELPVIAAVDGPAVGAGFSIALAADLILASTRAVFCMSRGRGLIPSRRARLIRPGPPAGLPPSSSQEPCP